MPLADTAFATTISGYLITALLALIGSGFTVFVASTRHRFDQQDKVLKELATSTAVTVSQIPEMKLDLSKNIADITNLKTATALLQQANRYAQDRGIYPRNAERSPE